MPFRHNLAKANLLRKILKCGLYVFNALLAEGVNKLLIKVRLDLNVFYAFAFGRAVKHYLVADSLHGGGVQYLRKFV